MLRSALFGALLGVLCAGGGNPALAQMQEVDFAERPSITNRIDQMITDCRTAGRSGCVQICESAKRVIAAEFAEHQAQIRVVRFEFGPCFDAHALAFVPRPAQ